MVELKVDVGRKDGFRTLGPLHDVKRKIISLPLGDPSASFDQFHRYPLAVKERLCPNAIPIQETDKWRQGSGIKKRNRHTSSCRRTSQMS